MAATLLYVGVNGSNGAANNSPIMGSIGLAVNGIGIYSNSDAEKRDAFVNEGKSFDSCGGHPQPQGDYHYHTGKSICY